MTVSFSQLETSFNACRSAVLSIVGSAASEIDEFDIAAPRTLDEAGFLRLIAWSYGALIEVGRVFIPFLLERPFASQAESELVSCRETRTRVIDLRTVSFHNLGLRNGAPSSKIARAESWYADACGVTEPETTGQWLECYLKLLRAVLEVVCSATASARALAEPEYDTTRDELNIRLLRSLPGHRFDRFIEIAARNLGVQLNARAFREQKLTEWRNAAKSILNESDLENQLRRHVEASVVDYVSLQSPLMTDEWIARLGLERGPSVGRVIRLSRELAKGGIRDIEEHVEQVRLLFLTS